MSTLRASATTSVQNVKDVEALKTKIEHMQHCCEMALQNLDKGSIGKQYDPSWIRPRQMAISEVKECCEQAYHWINRAIASETLTKILEGEE